MTGRPILAAVAVLGAGCSAAPDDRSDEVFARELLEISIELPPAEWDALRQQHRSRHLAFGDAGCCDRPQVNPYTWFTADVTIDGEHFPDVGVRKKGFLGSQSTLKPSLKLRFDKHVAGQTLLGLDRLALNNSRQDSSYARTCLAFAVFSAAGVPAPRCTWAHVTVNGADHGVFVAVEEVRDLFLRRQLGTDTGNLYEGTINDFRDAFDGGFQQETNETLDPSRADLARVTTVLAEASDDELEVQLAPLVALDKFYRFWATETLIWHRDGYAGNTNNFYVYADPDDGGRLRFIPWGPDGAFGAAPLAGVPASVLAFGVLANRLYATPAGRDRFYQELDGLIARVWNASELVAEAERIAGVVGPRLPAADQALLATALDELRTTIDGRVAAIADARAAGPPAWTAPLRQPPCRLPVGPIDATFTTTWSSLAQGIFAAGTGTLSVALDAQPIAPTRIGARAGDPAAPAPTTRVQLFVDHGGNRRLTLVADMPGDARFFEPYSAVGTHRFLSPPLNLNVTEHDISVMPPALLRRFDVGEGTWTFDAIELRDGAPVTGSFAATLYAVP